MVLERATQRRWLLLICMIKFLRQSIKRNSLLEFSCMTYLRLLTRWTMAYCLKNWNGMVHVRGIALNWIKSYFSDRKQFVQVDDSCSTLKSITCGVPHGSILGPLLFLIYINYICNVLSLAKLILFADDTSLFFSHANPVHLINMVNQELEKISIWLRVNKLSLNVGKTKFMIFSPRQKRLQVDFRMVLNDREISQVEEIVFWGLF